MTTASVSHATTEFATMANLDHADGGIGSISNIPTPKPTTMMTRTKMKIKNALLAIATVLLAIASAGQTKAGPEAGPNLGTIIVYRPRSIIDCAITNWEFNLNHGPDLIIRSGTYYRLTVLPGDSIISHDNVPFIDEDEQTVHVEPGQTVYFQYMILRWQTTKNKRPER